MKARNFTTLAVVAVGVVALGAPAAFAQAPDISGLNGDLKKLNSIGKAAKKQARDARKKSKFETRTDNDIKRLGNNVHDLRKQIDQTNFTISNIVTGLTPVLTQLGAAAQSYANFEYGVAQMTLNGVPYGPGFMVTSRIEPTAQQATVTKQFACLTNPSAGLTCTAGDKIGFAVAVRSVDPDANNTKSTAACTMTASQDTGANVSAGGGTSNVNVQNWGVTAPSGTAINSQVPFYGVKRVPLPPKAESEKASSLFSMVTSEFAEKTTFLTAADGTSLGTGDTIPSSGGLKAGNFAVTNANTGAGMITATLSCMAVPKT